MAPDLNSVPPSPRISSSPRLGFSFRNQPQPQQQEPQSMAPPALPPSQSSTSSSASQSQPPPQPQATNILPSNQAALHQTVSPPLASSSMATVGAGVVTGDNTGVGSGPGPLRHPRPLTAADLHLQLEKEQEAVVNRLTRELSLLRAAHNASVVSNTSSTSTGLPDTLDHNANHLLSGPSHPTPSSRRHHRSSSATSNRSISALASLSSLPSTTADRTRVPQGIVLSRQNSTTNTRSNRSGASSPAPSNPGSYQPLAGEHFPSFYHARPIPYRDPSSSSLAMMSADSLTSVQTTGRYEEAAYHRHELDAVKRENEALKRKIRDLERTLRERRQSDASVERLRSESVSTTASARDGGGVGLGLGSGVGFGVERGRERVDREEGEEAVQVGESARGHGL
ncbi:hypothetical protein QTJ16_004432 [Diplocarpon rosae]|uniref:Uncharacterized protein n=1 Tax=Diplocarpon rosae TaxID=946125 RepID=A0AAD9SYY5_9HELO|nr:hypothetical protein QTJ16_004432 [Diplocarpon rosae]